MAEKSSRRASQRWYPPELRERAIRMVFESITETGERRGAVTRVTEERQVGNPG